MANSNGSFRDTFAAWSSTFVGKVTLSAVRAFVGVFIAAQAQLFDAVVKLANSHSQVDWGTTKTLLVSLAAAAVTAAIRAVQHFIFDKKA